MTDLFQSRARALNISPKRLAANTKRSLASARATLEKMAAPYADIDNSVEGALQELMVEFDKFEERINETVEYLLEPEGT